MLSVKDLTIAFPSPGGDLRAVDGLSFAVAAGEFFVIIGESGSGKTLTGAAITGLLPVAARISGSVVFRGTEMVGQPDSQLRRIRGRNVGVIYQDPLSAMNPVQTVGAQIAEAIVIHGLGDRNFAARHAVEMLDRVRLSDPARVANAYPHEISGGMRQRAMIAMALACSPQLLIADEPTTALDVTVKRQILELLLNLRSEMGLTVILITHDMGVVAEVADRILVMYGGRVAEIGAAAGVLGSPSHPYTKSLLLSAGLSEAPFKSKLPAIPGSAPGLSSGELGCRFEPRCARAQSDCMQTTPVLASHERSDVACFHPLHGGGLR